MANEPAGRSVDDDLERARSGDQAAFSALIRAHQNMVYSVALRMLASRDGAEDLTQEVFMQLSSSLSSLESGKHLTFWLRRVTANRAIDQLRHRARFPETSLDDEDELHLAAPSEDPLLLQHLGGLLSALSPAARAVMVLRYQEDLDPADIARTLNMPVNTVKSHLTRSLDCLREQILGCTDDAARRGPA